VPGISSLECIEMGDPVSAEIRSSTLRGIFLKIVSVAFFVSMASCIKAAGEGVPPGEIVFFRSSMAMVPVLLYLMATGQLRTAFVTDNLRGHFGRGLVGVTAMGFGFFGLTRLPLPDAIALGYANPLIVVVLAALVLGETIRLYRWSAVGAGFVGVMIISWPSLTLFDSGVAGTDQSLGVIAVLLSAVLAAVAIMLVRRLVDTEKTPTIVLYFSLTATVLSLATWPFGWVTLEPMALLLLVSSGILGGIGQILMTESYRHAPVSTIAPFEYTSILIGIAVGYFLFGYVPGTSMLIGTAIVVAAGLFIIVREQRLGIDRKGARRFTTPQG
jgi:drug/metabolite transporter (DMT)-like permease